MTKLFRFIRNKWVYKLCPHCCLFCRFRHEHFIQCWNEITIDNSEDIDV